MQRGARSLPVGQIDVAHRLGGSRTVATAGLPCFTVVPCSRCHPVSQGPQVCTFDYLEDLEVDH